MELNHFWMSWSRQRTEQFVRLGMRRSLAKEFSEAEAIGRCKVEANVGREVAATAELVVSPVAPTGSKHQFGLAIRGDPSTLKDKSRVYRPTGRPDVFVDQTGSEHIFAPIPAPPQTGEHRETGKDVPRSSGRKRSRRKALRARRQSFS